VENEALAMVLALPNIPRLCIAVPNDRLSFRKNFVSVFSLEWSCKGVTNLAKARPRNNNNNMNMKI
jgi:hypothetical protein